MSLDTAKKIYHSLIQPHFYYCCTVWDGINDQLTEKLQKLQNRAARVLIKSSYEVSSSPLLEALGWENLIPNRLKHKAILVFKSLRNIVPVQCIPAKFCCRFSANYDPINSVHKLALSKPRAEYLKRGFSCSGAALWNSLPQDLRVCNSLGILKRSLKVVILL